jgi:hypothetical protein
LHPSGHRRKVSDPESYPDPDLSVRSTDTRIRIQIRGYGSRSGTKMSRIPTATDIPVGWYLVMRGVAQVNIADGDNSVAGVELVGGGGGGAAQHVLDEDAGEGRRVGAFRRLQLAPHYRDAQALPPHKQKDM